MLRPWTSTAAQPRPHPDLHPPRLLGRLRRGCSPPSTTRRASRRRRQQDGRAPRRLLVLHLRRRDDLLRPLARDRAPDLHQPLRPARAAAAAELGTGSSGSPQASWSRSSSGRSWSRRCRCRRAPARSRGSRTCHWEPKHAAAFAANLVLFAVIAPFVEELTFRGAGQSLLALPRPLAVDRPRRASRSASRTDWSRRCSSSSRSASRSPGSATARTASCRGCSCTASSTRRRSIAIVLR